MDDIPHALGVAEAGTGKTTGRRLIERWLPIAALGEESVRERRSLQALPPTYYLHVWWARRPLVASRAAALASVLPENADREKFLHALGIHGDPVRTRQKIDRAKKTGEDLGLHPYGYERAFKYSPSDGDRAWISQNAGSPDASSILILDPTAGGGSIPFEAARLGLASLANDLNPVAALIEKATIEYPITHGATLAVAFNNLAREFIRRATPKFNGIFPPESPGTQILGYLWARTIRCPYCDGLIPLSPNWRLAPDGTGVRLRPHLGISPNSEGRVCEFEIVRSYRGTVPGHGGRWRRHLPVSRLRSCRRRRRDQAASAGGRHGRAVVRGRVQAPHRDPHEIRQAGKGQMGTRLSRPPAGGRQQRPIAERLAEKMPEWEALDMVPSGSNPVRQ